jgi:hypothetical protein
MIAMFELELLNINREPGMNRRNFLALSSIATFYVALLPFGQSAYAADPTSAGTWELNVAKSKSTDPMPKSITRTYEPTETTEKMTGTVVTADGKTIPISFTATLDGKDVPNKAPGADTLSLTRVDALTITFVSKLAGKPVLTGTRVISKDGKTMTFEQKGTNAAGAPVESTMVYDKR